MDAGRRSQQGSFVHGHTEHPPDAEPGGAGGQVQRAGDGRDNVREMEGAGQKEKRRETMGRERKERWRVRGNGAE